MHRLVHDVVDLLNLVATRLAVSATSFEQDQVTHP